MITISDCWSPVRGRRVNGFRHRAKDTLRERSNFSDISKNKQLADYYANADVFVHPNPKEPFGIAPLEAMASGVATVAPNAGGILSYATNENAWLVEPTGEKFAAAVREIINDPLLRERKIANALATARANTREASTDRLFAAYDKIYEHFHKHRDLFVDVDAARKFDFVEEILSDN